jgi:putative phosphoesterase
MKILILADIHANWEALSTFDSVEESWDACLFIGDLVDYGVTPGPCVDWVREHATAWVRGNHDHAVAQRVTARGGTGYRALAAATRPLHWELLNDVQMGFLARMPVTRYVTLGGMTFFLVHGTPHDPLDEYLAADHPDLWQKRLENIQADFVCVGHTHLPFHLDLGDTQVINPGSIGQPRDGDWRGSYAMVEDGRVSFHRFEYDVEATLRAVRDRGINGEALRVAEQTLRTGGQIASSEPAPPQRTALIDRSFSR